MVRVTYKPFEEIIIHDIVKYSLEDFITMNSLGAQTGGLGRPLNWVDGVAFIQAPMPPTDEIIKDQLEGKIHWAQLAFAIMPKFQSYILVKEGQIRIPVIDLGDNEIFRDVIAWLKERFKNVTP